MAMTYISLATHQGAAALLGGVSLVCPPCQQVDWARVFYSSWTLFSICISARICHQDPGQHAVLGLNE